ncbi:MAG: hypothetical protein NBV77_06575 [Bacteroidia bacterium]|nr:hypothetical protein [Bacteroidia bacterium]
MKWLKSEYYTYLLLILGTIGTIYYLYLGRTLEFWHFSLGVIFTISCLLTATSNLKGTDYPFFILGELFRLVLFGLLSIAELN